MKQDKVVEGPLGLKMSESVARKIEAIGKSAPSGDEFKFRRMATKAAEFTLDSGSRSDVSLITTEDVDRDEEVVISKGVSVTDYNGVVAWCHDYEGLPLGRSLWIKPTQNGLLAKSYYAPRPEGWTTDWMPDAVLSLMQMDPPICTGKSIGFIPLNVRLPSQKEISARPEFGKKGVLVIDKCALLEYSVCPIPVNQSAEMVTVSKSFPSLREVYIKAIKETEGIWLGEKPKEIQKSSFVKSSTFSKAVAERVRGQLKSLSSEASLALGDQLMMKMGRP